MPLGKDIQNIAVMGATLNGVIRNMPAAYSSRQKQYFEPETSKFIQENAQYSSDYFLAQVQGLKAENFYEWETQLIRMADLVNASASMTKIIDDYKMVMFANPAIDYVPRGAKINTAGSTWLVTNPLNISSVAANTVAERCNAVWNHLDYYGNVLSEPLVVEKGAAKSASNDKQEYVLITQGYYNVKAQYNQYTATLGQNSRILLGSKAYAVHGFTDFIQEFTGDYDTVHLCEFSIYFEEPNEEIDDLQRHIAGGLTFSWDMEISGMPTVNIGTPVAFQVSSRRNGETVVSSEEYPISYTWSSSADDIASVSADGVVTGIAEGQCEILCTLQQNETVAASYWVKVEAAGAGMQVAFDAAPPAALEAYQSVQISARCYENGSATDNSVTWNFGGADANAYSAAVDGSTVTITCWGPSQVPLEITASYGEESASASIELLGV